LAGIIFKAALAWRASMQTIGTPRAISPFHSQTDKGPVSSPARVRANGSRAAAITSGHVVTFRSATQYLLLVNDADRGRLLADIQPGIMLRWRFSS
jgi:hypothetical protein